MICPHCRSSATTRHKHRTALGYPRFKCRLCGRRCNERTGTLVNDLQCPTDLVVVAVRWRLRYKRSFRDVAELLLPRGFEVTHETIRAWEYRFAPVLAAELRRKRRGRAGVSWYLDETYVKVAGRWGSLYRAIDGAGELLDSMLSEHRDKHAARRFLRRLLEVGGRTPLRVTPDHHPAYRKAIRWILGRRGLHRRSQYLNNLTEQDHRAIKQRSYPMLGFGRFESAARFCAAFDELRQDFRVRRRGGPHVPLPDQRRLFLARWHGLITEMATSSRESIKAYVVSLRLVV